jgi:hypothetical protein
MMQTAQDRQAKNAQHTELVPKNQDFFFQCSPRPEQPDQGTPEQPAQIGHQK